MRSCALGVYRSGKSIAFWQRLENFWEQCFRGARAVIEQLFPIFKINLTQIKNIRQRPRC